MEQITIYSHTGSDGFQWNQLDVWLVEICTPCVGDLDHVSQVEKLKTFLGLDKPCKSVQISLEIAQYYSRSEASPIPLWVNICFVSSTFLECRHITAMLVLCLCCMCVHVVRIRVESTELKGHIYRASMASAWHLYRRVGELMCKPKKLYTIS